MKKYMTLAVVAMMMAAAGCQKMNDIQTENQDFKIEFTVADKPSFGTDTKAVKTSWAVGDQIAIALKPSSETNVLYRSIATAVRSSVAVLLEYTAGGWTATGNITPEAGTNGTFYAIHHRGDVNFNFTSIGGTSPENSYELAGYQGGELMSFTGSYNVASNGNLILESITMALDTRLMQVSVADEMNGGNLYLSQGYDKEYDLTCEIPEPEKTVKMSIYQDWSTGDSPTTPLKGYIALCNDRVSLDFSKASLFVYSSSADALGATPVINIYDEYDFDYSFWFANTAKAMFPPTSYTFFINRTAATAADYTIHTDEDEVLMTIEYDSSTRKLAPGKAVKLPTNTWTAK